MGPIFFPHHGRISIIAFSYVANIGGFYILHKYANPFDSSLVIGILHIIELCCFSIVLTFSKKNELKILQSIESKTQSKVAEKRRFIKLLSHTSRNTYSGIIPNLERIKNNNIVIKNLDSKCTSNLKNCVACAEYSKRKMEGILMSFEEAEDVKIVGENSELNMKIVGENFCLEEMLIDLKESIVVEVALLNKGEVNAKVHLLEGCFEGIRCNGEGREIKSIIENAIWGFIEKYKAAEIACNIEFNRKKCCLGISIYNEAGEEDYSKKIDQSCESNPMELNVAFQNIKKFGGSVQLIEKSGSKRVLDISIPLQVSQAEKNGNSIEGEKLSVLIVDDFICSRMAIRKFVEYFSEKDNFSVEIKECEDGHEAFSFLKLKTFFPDLIFTDYNMPDWNGDKFAQKVKEFDILAGWCDIFLVSGGSFHDLDKFLKSNNLTELIPKPVYPKQVQQRLINTVRKRRNSCKLKEVAGSTIKIKEIEGKELGSHNGVIDTINSEKGICLMDVVNAFLVSLKRASKYYLVSVLVISACFPEFKRIVVFYFACLIVSEAFLNLREFGVVIVTIVHLSRRVIMLYGFPPARLAVLLDFFGYPERRSRCSHVECVSTSLFTAIVAIVGEIYYELFIGKSWSIFLEMIAFIPLMKKTNDQLRKLFEVTEEDKIMIEESILNLGHEEESLEEFINFASNSEKGEIQYLEYYSKKVFSHLAPSMDEKTKKDFNMLFYNINRLKKDKNNLSIAISSNINEEKKNSNISRNGNVKFKFIIDTIREQVQFSKNDAGCDSKVELFIEPRLLDSSVQSLFFGFDPSAVSSVLINLLRNAFENSNKGLIKISINSCLDKKSEKVKISILNSAIIPRKSKFDQDECAKSEEGKKISNNLLDNIGEGIEIITERGVIAGEESGNPRLKIGLLCCKKLLMSGSIPNSELFVTRRKNGDVHSIFSFTAYSHSEIVGK